MMRSMVAMVGDAYDREELAAALWSTYPLGAAEALLTPTEHLPDGTLLGRFRLDPLDQRRVDGEVVDVLAEAGPAYDPIRRALLERAGRSLLVPDAELDEMFTLIETHWCGPWDAPWQLIGLLPPSTEEPLDAMAPAFQAVHLVTIGSGHPADGLQGLIAPPPVFGLWLVFEGFDRDDAGNRIGEHRMHLVVLADGRWGIRKVRRVDSPYHPLPDSTLGGKRLDEGVRAGRDDAPFTTSSTDAIGGTVPETLARVLQVNLDPAIEPHEGLLRLLARISVDTARRGLTQMSQSTGVDGDPCAENRLPIRTVGPVPASTSLEVGGNDRTSITQGTAPALCWWPEPERVGRSAVCVACTRFCDSPPPSRFSAAAAAIPPAPRRRPAR